MTSIDIFFWLLAALLAGSIWAIEAGVASRHRNALLSGMGSALLTMLFLMFWVDDRTAMVPLTPETFEKKKGGGGGGKLDFGGSGGGGGGKGGSDSKEDGGPDEDAPQQDEGDGKMKPFAPKGLKTAEADDGSGNGAREYSKEPFKDCPVCPDMVIVPSGVAQVGFAADDNLRQPNEQSAIPVPMPKPFAIGRLEILRRDFSAYVEETGFQSRTMCDVGRRRGVFNWQRPGFEQDERHPVVCLTWPEIRMYLVWLSDKSGRTYRLPTENEWEHAARAGTQTPYSMGQTIHHRTVNAGRTRDGTTAGGLLGMNQWGLSDMAGNVWEMTSQCEYEPGTITNIRPEQHDCRRLLKGGSWASQAFAARHAARRLANEGFTSNDIGFRVMREVDDGDDERVLTPAQKRALAQAERDAAEIEQRERESLEEDKRKLRAEAEAKLKGPAKK